MSPSDVNLQPEVISRIEEELGQSSSGSLVDLLEDQRLSNVATSGVIIRRQKEEGTSPGVIIGIIVGVVALLAVLALIVMFVF